MANVWESQPHFEALFWEIFYEKINLRVGATTPSSQPTNPRLVLSWRDFWSQIKREIFFPPHSRSKWKNKRLWIVSQLGEVRPVWPDDLDKNLPDLCKKIAQMEPNPVFTKEQSIFTSFLSLRQLVLAHIPQTNSAFVSWVEMFKMPRQGMNKSLRYVLTKNCFSRERGC